MPTLTHVFIQIATWFLRILGITLDLRELLAIIFGGGSVSVMSAFSLAGLPAWATALAMIGFFALACLLLSLILGRFRKRDRIRQVIPTLKNTNSRLTQLAYKQVKQSRDKDLENLGLELTRLIDLTEHQTKMLRRMSRIDKRTQTTIEKKVQKAMRDSLPTFLLKLENLAYKHGIAVTSLAEKDFRYLFYKRQLDNLRPVPNLDIDKEVDSYLDYSIGLNNFLVLNQLAIPYLHEKLSEDAEVTSRTYPRLIEKAMNQELVKVNVKIEEYLKPQTERTNK